MLGWVAHYRFTDYFEKRVLPKRLYLTKELCIRVVEEPVRIERQEGNRYRFWRQVPEPSVDTSKPAIDRHRKTGH